MTDLEKQFESALTIDEDIFRAESIIDKDYYPADIPSGTNLNSDTSFTMDISQSNSWLQPSESYLYLEGRVLANADGTRIGKLEGSNKQWPDFALLNNFFPYLFSSVKYSISNVEVEGFSFPGQCTTMYHLLTKERDFNGLDEGWELDTYDGSASTKDIQYYPFVPAIGEMNTVGGNPTAAEFRNAIKVIIHMFNRINATDIPNLADADIPCAGANPTAAEMLQAVNRVITRLNEHVSAPEIPPMAATTFPAATSDAFRVGVFKTCTEINRTIANKDPLDIRFNSGYVKRKDYLFDPAGNVMGNNTQGNFSFRIPLSLLFNFCEQSKKPIFNRKHSLTFARQLSLVPIFKPVENEGGSYLSLDLLRWYMPAVRFTPTLEAMYMQQIANNVLIPFGFMNKTVNQYNIINGLNNFSESISYNGDTEKPRYLVFAFQAVDRTITGHEDRKNINSALFNNCLPNTRRDAMVDVRSIEISINSKTYIFPKDADNNMDQNRIARWYNEYKNFAKSYRNNYDEKDMVSYQDFRNRYRLYVVDISKRINDVIPPSDKTPVRVAFRIYFNKPIANDATTEMYVLSLMDRYWLLNSDGDKAFRVS